MSAAVFDDVVGQEHAIDVLTAAVAASRGDAGVPAAAMTHAWLFTGPPGSGRSVAARAFAAALECEYGGCGHCCALPDCAGRDARRRPHRHAGGADHLGQGDACRSCSSPPAGRRPVASRSC